MSFLLLPVDLLGQNVLSATSKTVTKSNNANSGTTLYSDNNQQPDSTQNAAAEGLVYEVTVESDSLLTSMVTSFMPCVRATKVYSVRHPLITPHGVELFDHVHGIDGYYYVDRGALGQNHLSLFPYNFDTERLLSFHDPAAPLTLSLQPDPFPALRQRLHRFSLFQTRRPYTSMQYGSSLNKDYMIGIVHTQNIKPRWNYAFLYDLTSRNGVYTNAGGTNHLLDISTNYFSADARYQVQASVTYNRMRQEENGGVQNDSTFWNSSRRQGVPVNMYSAQNQWRDIALDIHQSYNTVRQFDHIVPVVRQIVDTNTTADTIWAYDTLHPAAPHVYNTGVFGLDIHLARHRRIFTDAQSNSWFYGLSSLDTSFFFDSTSHFKASADLYWTNDAYMRHKWVNPLVLLFGIRPEFNRVMYAGSIYSAFNISPFAQMTLNKGRLRFVARAEEVNGTDRNGDYRIQGNMELSAGSQSLFNVAICSEALDPDRLYYHSEGCYNWDITGFNKIKRQQLALAYTMDKSDSIKGHIRLVETRSSATLLSDNVWLNSNMSPVQANGTAMLLQAKILTQLQFGWFNMRLQQMVQHSGNNDIIRVPLFASKNSVYVDIRIFKGTLRLQTGFDIRYHTPYKADAWNPVLAAFYRQDDVEVGDYVVADFWLTMQIKRASIYLKASHFNSMLEDFAGLQPNYFSLPHYPMEDFGLYWGVIWKFFD